MGMPLGGSVKILVLWFVLAAHGILHAQGTLKLSGGGVGDLTRPGIRIKTYKLCAQADSCSSHRWVGVFGANLLAELKNDSAAYAQGRLFRTSSIVKSGFYAAVPVSLFSGTLESMKGKESIVIGLTLVSLAGAVASHIFENKQFYKIEEIYNRNRIRIGVESGNGFDKMGLICQVKL